MFKVVAPPKAAIDRDCFRLMVKALGRVYRAPEVRSEKMQTLAQAVRKRTYRIDCRKLADRLILGLFFGCF